MTSSKKAPKAPATAKKAEAPASTATLEAPASAPVSGFAPYVRPTGSGFAPRTPGFLGYGKGTGTEALAEALAGEAGISKADLVSLYVEKTGKPEKAAKSSLSVFLSDSVRPFGRYYASRGLSLEISGDLYRFSPESVEKARAAVEAGALEALRAIPEKARIETDAKFRAFLSRFGFAPASEE